MLTPEQLAEARSIATRTAAKYVRRLPGGEGHEQDAAQEAVLEVLLSAHRWDPSRGAWGAFVGTVVARTVRRTLHVLRAPVHGSPWRAHRWTVGLSAEGGDTLETLGTDEDFVGAVFATELRARMLALVAHVPHHALGLAVVLGEQPAARVASEAGVPRAIVDRAAASVRVAFEDSIATVTLWKELTHD